MSDAENTQGGGGDTGKPRRSFGVDIAAMSQVSNSLAGINAKLASAARMFEADQAAVAAAWNLGSVKKLQDSLRVLMSEKGQIKFDIKSIEVNEIIGKDLVASMERARSLRLSTIHEEDRRVFLSAMESATRKLAELGIRNLFSQQTEENIRLVGRLFKPSCVLAEFTTETLGRMGQTQDTNVARALKASLELAEAQHVANVGLLEAIAQDLTVGEPAQGVWTLKTPYSQRDELLARRSVADDLAVVETQSDAAASSKDCRNLLSIITQCNKVFTIKHNKEEEIFKPTTRVLEVYNVMPWITPDGQESFGEFVDCLYFLLYESPGKDKLRFLSDYGGPLTRSDCEVVWCVKHFRNKWLRHDPDHGAASDIAKSRRELSAHFQRLGLPGFPTTPDDYRTLHRALLAEASRFVEKLSRSI